MTPQEEVKAQQALLEKHCHAIFMTDEEIRPYLRFYERLMRPNMHNFVDPGDYHTQALNDWAEYKNINKKIAHKIREVRQTLKADTIWIHGDQFMMVPQYIRQNENPANRPAIGFYFH